MRRAILSDVHGNLEALRAVLEDIRGLGGAQIVCLGDIVGYGPNPRECVDAAMQFDVTITGNHDQAALFDPEGFSSAAERAIFWTRRQLEQAPESEPGDERGRAEGGEPDGPAAAPPLEDGVGELARTERRLEFLSGLPRAVRDGGVLFVHGSPRNPLNEYVFPDDIYNGRKLKRVFGLFDHVCFSGHTHMPGVFTADGRYLLPEDLGGRYVLDDQKVMINVGSVGQPRDGDPRACYVLLEDGVVHFRRVAYPVEQTIAKILAIGELDDFLGHRLREGR